MKKIVIVSFAAIFAFAISCTNENYLLYDETAKNSLYFMTDSVEYSYGFDQDKDIDLTIPTKVIGFTVAEPKSVDVNIVAAEGSTATDGVEYVINSCVLKNDTVSVNLDFKKSALTFDKEYKLILELKSNNDFNATGVTKCVVLFSNSALVQPAWWLPSFLGEHTQEKHAMFVSLFWESEEKSELVFNNIAKNWGRNLDQRYLPYGPSYPQYEATAYLLTRNPDYFKKYVLNEMYDYYLDSGDIAYEIPNPNA